MADNKALVDYLIQRLGEIGFDKLSLARGTEQQIKDNITKIQPYEFAIATDTERAFYKKPDGTLGLIVSHNVGDVTAEGQKQIDAIIAEATKYINNISNEGVKQTNLVVSQGNTEVTKVRAEGESQMRALQSVSADSIYQTPNSAFIGGIKSENGNIYASGILKNILGLYDATLETYGDSNIFRSTNFNAIAYGNKLYTGEGFKNEATLETYRAYNTATMTGNTVSLVSTRNISKGAYSISSKNDFKLDTFYTFSFDCSEDDFDYFTSTSKIEITKESIGSHHKITFKTTSTSSNIAFYVKGNIVTGRKVIVKNVQLTEGAKEKPPIPLQYVMPDCGMQQEGTGGLNFDDYSYIIKGVDGNKDGSNANIYFRSSSGSLYSYTEDLKDNMLYSGVYQNTGINISSLKTERLSLGKANVGGATSVSFSEFLVYKGSLTQLQLESERDKNIIYEDSTNINEVVKENMKDKALIGEDVKGIIEDGNSHIVGNIYYSRKLFKYYRCLVANSDNYIDASKWKEINFKQLQDEIDANEALIKSLPQNSVTGYGEDVVLFNNESGAISGAGDITLNEDFTHFSYIGFEIANTVGNLAVDSRWEYIPTKFAKLNPTATGNNQLNEYGFLFLANSFESLYLKNTTTVYTTGNRLFMRRIVGLDRKVAK